MELEDLRLVVYRAFAANGQVPTNAVLADALGETENDVLDALRGLAAARHVVLDDAGRVLMAHPFSAVPLGFSVMGQTTLWWGGCAWDAFAIPHLVAEEPDVLVATRCPGCDAALAWTVQKDAPPTGDEVAHFLVPVRQMWTDVVYTCGHQRLFCSSECVDDWLRRHHLERGFQMDLTRLWRLAQHWYDGRLDRDYVRRDPAESSAYFRAVGLDGPFWTVR
jgi:hypothetical protein